MTPEISEHDAAILRVAHKRFICPISAILSHVEDQLYKFDNRGYMREFTLKIPRPNFVFAPYRVKFSRAALSCIVDDMHYHRYSPDVAAGGSIETSLLHYLQNLPRVSEQQNSEGRMYRL